MCKFTDKAIVDPGGIYKPDFSMVELSTLSSESGFNIECSGLFENQCGKEITIEVQPSGKRMTLKDGESFKIEDLDEEWTEITRIK